MRLSARRWTPMVTYFPAWMRPQQMPSTYPPVGLAWGWRVLEQSEGTPRYGEIPCNNRCDLNGSLQHFGEFL